MRSGADFQPVSSPEQVLLLASDPLLVEDVRAALSRARFQVHQASDTTVAARLLADWQVDLSIVDFDLNAGELVDWCVSAPSPLAQVPVIAVTRSPAVSSRLAALDRGADDALNLPLLPEELVARVRALLRRARGSRTGLTPLLRTGELEIDFIRRKTTLRGVDLQLTPVEQSLLYLLASNTGRVLSREAILNALWGPDYAPESNIVDRHILNLRAKLDDDWRHPRFISTVSGQGYRFFVATGLERQRPRRGRPGGQQRPTPLRLLGTTGGPLDEVAWRMRARA